MESTSVIRKTCWESQNCTPERREHCPAGKSRERGYSCWKWTGTLCHGVKQNSLQEKLTLCRQCAYYNSDDCIK